MVRVKPDCSDGHTVRQLPFPNIIMELLPRICSISVNSQNICLWPGKPKHDEPGLLAITSVIDCR